MQAFRDQDFLDRDPDWLLNDWTKFFGRPHIHPTSGAPEGWPEFHLVYRSASSNFNYQTDTRLTSSVWHSDVRTAFDLDAFRIVLTMSHYKVTYEKQPPGLTSLMLFDSPPSGGDTGYADQRAAYQHLSPLFREKLEGLEVLHSGVAQAEYSRAGKRGGIVKREPVENWHPIVRTHPVTGEKALFVNRQFSRKIKGLKEEESEAILQLLYNHIEKGADFQTRLRWKPRTVVLWDSKCLYTHTLSPICEPKLTGLDRITAHTATVDFDKGGHRRHGTRLTPQAEKPAY